MRYRILLSYDGAPFSGWQVQDNAVTVQGCLQKALETLLREEVSVTGAGRTDSEVNAIAYTAHFDSSAAPDFFGPRGRCKLNAILPPGIIVHQITPEAPEFHSRFDAVSREYKYFLHRRKDPFVAKFSWLCTYPLDVDKMNEAAAMILGTRDFSCFEKTGGNNKTSVCTVTGARWERYVPDHVRLMGYPAEDGDYLVFTISANRFLRNMVRAVVGSLIEIGRGKHEPEWMLHVLKSGNRSVAGESVPGHALFLTSVKYL